MAKTRELVSTADAPAAIGPYNQAVIIGDLVFCSGQIALDPKTGALIDGGLEAQTRQVLDNLEAVLAAAGTSLANAVKTTIFLADMNDFAAVNQIYGERVGGEPPARVCVEVSRLPKDARVEIDAIAIR